MPAQDAWSGGGIITLAAFDPNGDPVKYFVGAEPEKEDGQRLQVTAHNFSKLLHSGKPRIAIFYNCKTLHAVFITVALSAQEK